MLVQAMTAPSSKEWVEEHFPAAEGATKATLILVFGAGFDAGMAEAEEILTNLAAELGIAS